MPKAGFWAIESGVIRFARDGGWYSDDEPIVNPRISKLFSRHLVQRDGAWWIEMGDEKARVVIDDTPWVVVRIDGSTEIGFTQHLNDDTTEPLAPASLTLSADGVLYAAVKSGAHRARFLRAPQAELLSHAIERDGKYFLPTPGGEELPLEKTSTCTSSS